MNAEKRVFFTLWDEQEFCGAFSTRQEAITAAQERVNRISQNHCSEYSDFRGKMMDSYREVDTLERLEAIMDDDCSELWAQCERT